MTPHVGDRDETEPRVLDPPLQHLGHDHLDAVGDLADAGRRHGFLLGGDCPAYVTGAPWTHGSAGWPQAAPEPSPRPYWQRHPRRRGGPLPRSGGDHRRHPRRRPPHGTAGDDVIVAGAGRDVVAGNAGADTVCGGLGPDLVTDGAEPTSSTSAPAPTPPSRPRTAATRSAAGPARTGSTTSWSASGARRQRRPGADRARRRRQRHRDRLRRRRGSTGATCCAAPPARTPSAATPVTTPSPAWGDDRIEADLSPTRSTPVRHDIIVVPGNGITRSDTYAGGRGRDLLTLPAPTPARPGRRPRRRHRPRLGRPFQRRASPTTARHSRPPPPGAAPARVRHARAGRPRRLRA